MSAEGVAPAPARRPATDPLAAAVFALLVAACFAAFFITQRLKHTPTVVQRFELTPALQPGSSEPEAAQEHISFKLANADAVTVTIVDGNEDTVATLIRDRHVPRYKQFSLRWNGRTGEAKSYGVIVSPSGHRTLVPENTGALAPPGEYRVRVHLRDQERQVLSPRSFKLEAG